ncbi:MAG: RNA pseudouridine synthase [Spirochaetes bacterium]|nr:RNA pseudouridine synthase [Spirochaetota bacterium]
MSSNRLTNFIKIGTAGKDDNNKRIDRIIRTIIPSLSLGTIYREIRLGKIRLNGEKTASETRVIAGDSIYIHKSLAEIVKEDIEKIASKKQTICQACDGLAAALPRLKDGSHLSRQPSLAILTSLACCNEVSSDPDAACSPATEEMSLSSSPSLPGNPHFPASQPCPCSDVRVAGQDAASVSQIEILFENSDFLVVNKPAGMLIHTPDLRRSSARNAGENCRTLDAIVKKLLIEKSRESLAFSPAPLHRLDKESSGIVFFSKSIEGARIFTSLLKEQKLVKKYIALLDGHLPQACTWKDSLAREDEKQAKSAPKEAITHIKPLLHSPWNQSQNQPCPSSGIRTHKGHFTAGQGAASVPTRALHAPQTLALVEIETGRYHQIRKHCSMHGFPLSGDKKYGGSAFKPAKQGKSCGFLLHCWKIEPKESKESEKPGFISITAPLPDPFMKTISDIFGKNCIKSLFAAED